MIVWHQLDLQVGTIYNGIYDYDRKWHHQPAQIIRKATKEEYIEQYKLEVGAVPGPISDLDGLFFYEVSTD